MPTKYSPRIQRPPSPYRSTQSPRPKSQQRVWRSLSGTGESDSSNAFAEKSREMWLNSLRRGGDTKNPASFMTNVSNPALSSAPDHLRAQLGLPNSARRRKRSNSVDLKSSPAAMQHKSKEDLCDEIIDLKRMLVLQKNDYEVLKTKTRRLEEENSRNSKFIEELLDKKTSDEKVRMLAEGGSRSSSAVNTGLKQKILKLEKRLSDKDVELSEIKRQMKITDTAEMKSAMEMYYQEVLRLQELIRSERLETSRLNSSINSMTGGNSARQSDLRKKIVQLVSENNKLTEENRRLRIDMDRALDHSQYKFSDNDDSDEEDVKYSALSKTELVALVKQTKSSKVRKIEQAKNEHKEETEKLRSIISNIKEERNKLLEENEKLCRKCDRLEKDVENQIEKVTDLRGAIEVLEKKTESRHDERPRPQRRSLSNDRRRSLKDTTPKLSEYSSDSETSHVSRPRSEYRRPSTPNARKIESLTPPQAKRRGSRRPATPNTRNNAAMSIQKHWHEHRNRKKRQDDIVALQSVLRGHIARREMLEQTRPVDVSRFHGGNAMESDENSNASDDIVYLH